MTAPQATVSSAQKPQTPKPPASSSSQALKQKKPRASKRVQVLAKELELLQRNRVEMEQLRLLMSCVIKRERSKRSLNRAARDLCALLRQHEQFGGGGSVSPVAVRVIEQLATLEGRQLQPEVGSFPSPSPSPLSPPLSLLSRLSCFYCSPCSSSYTASIRSCPPPPSSPPYPSVCCSPRRFCTIFDPFPSSREGIFLHISPKPLRTTLALQRIIFLIISDHHLALQPSLRVFMTSVSSMSSRFSMQHTPCPLVLAYACFRNLPAMGLRAKVGSRRRASSLDGVDNPSKRQRGGASGASLINLGHRLMQQHQEGGGGGEEEGYQQQDPLALAPEKLDRERLMTDMEAKSANGQLPAGFLYVPTDSLKDERG